MSRVAVAAAAAALAVPAAADAARVSVVDWQILYVAATGERNDAAVTAVSVRETVDATVVNVTLRDAGAAIDVGGGCVSAGAGGVTCSVETFFDMDVLHVRLGDGDDRFTAAGTCVELDECILSVDGGEGDDTIVGSESIDFLSGGPGDDALDGRESNQAWYYVTPIGDGLVGGDGADTLRGGDGIDFLDGGKGADDLSGGNGLDSVSYERRSGAVVADLDGDRDDGVAGEGDLIAPDVEALLGGTGDDRLQGDARRNKLVGGDGDDVLSGRAGRDYVAGDRGNDVLRGGPDADTLVGSGHNARGWLSPDGKRGTDLMYGGSGDDAFIANDGRRDLLYGGRGRDRASFDCGLDRVRAVERPPDGRCRLAGRPR